MNITSVGVFCGSGLGAQPAYRAAASELGRTLAEKRIRVVYGGAGKGLMSCVADAALEAGGEVVGVIPQYLVAKEVAHRGLADLRITESMHARKALIMDLSDVFIALPGGLGTLEELAEVLAWLHLGIQAKACGILNVGGFFNRLLEFLEHAAEEAFVPPRSRNLLLVGQTPEELLGAIERRWRC